MSLSDLKKLAVRRSVNIRFRIADGVECIVTSQGIGRIPSLKHRPEFNLESELARVEEFILEPADGDPRGRRGRQKEQKLNRSELEQAVAGA